jgi:hypothetical protein
VLSTVAVIHVKGQNMASESLYREDLEPLCPVDFLKMHSINEEPPTFKCPEDGCNVHWNRLSGYFYPDSEDITKRTSLVGFLKMGFVVEHGYFYLASIDSRRKTWRCSVKDCQDATIENY